MITETLSNRRQDRSFWETLYWAGALIWAGLVFAAEASGLLPQIGNADAWSWVFAGVGLYGTLMNIYNLASPDTANPTTWDFGWSGFWLLVGLSGFLAVDIFWPLALILVGGAVLIQTLRRS